MKIIISTGIYPPEIGGPAEYARQLFDTLLIQNHEVTVVTYGEIKRFPTGLRHLAYFYKLLIDGHDTEYIIALDTFSVAFPAFVFSKLFRKKMVVRVAGDFLWESFVSRTKEHILLSEFYNKRRSFTLKEKIIFVITRFILRHCSGIVFSTTWQKDIMILPYKLLDRNIFIVENFFNPLRIDEARQKVDGTPKVFLSPSRGVEIKNQRRLERAFAKVSEKYSDIILDTKPVSREVLVEKIPNAYAIVVASLSDVSPNLVLDALQYDIPVIVTTETGIRNRLEGQAVFVDPLSEESISHGLEKLLDEKTYLEYKKRIMENTFSHSWNEIAQEFLDIYKKL